MEEALGGRLEGLSGDLMWTASCGNALYIRHLVEGAVEAGTLRQVRGVWQFRGRTAVTSELASLLDARIEQLPEEEAHTLQLLAFAEPLSLDALSMLVGQTPSKAVERRGLIRVVEDAPGLNVRFAHPLYGEVIRRGLGRAATRRLRANCFPRCRSSRFTCQRNVFGSRNWRSTATRPPTRSFSPPPRRTPSR